MLGSVARLGWRRSLAGAPRWVLLSGLLGLGCASELEGAAALVDEELLEPLPPLLPAAPEAPPEPDDEAAPPSAREQPPSPAVVSEDPPDTFAPPSDEGTDLDLPLAPAPLVPDSEHCAAVADWDPLWVQFEEEVLLLVNEARSQPANCGDEGVFAAAEPLAMDPVLRCSARLHSLDMFERRFFNHVNPDGEDPFERMGAAGFRGGGAENIAVGQTSPAQVMRSWMDSDGHCANVMRRSYTLLGVGYHPGAGKRGLSSNFWTQNFGAPPRSCRSCR